MVIPSISTVIRTTAHTFRGKVKGKMPFYAVRQGRNAGIYNDWDSCKEQVHGYSGARYKKFNSAEEAQAFVDGSDSGGYSSYSSSSNSGYSRQTYSSLSGYNGAQSYSSTSSYNAGQSYVTAPSYSGGSNSHYTYSQPKKYTSGHRSTPYSYSNRQYTTCSSSSGSGSTEAEDDHVYTDGCCRNNGQRGSVAGIGVYWGPSHPCNVSERLPGRPTNNRAEIHAARVAVKQAKERNMESVTVVTDSQFLINGMTSWIHSWKKNGWTLSDKSKVKNVEDWKALDAEMQGINVKFKHVRGHTGIDGNEEADRLANEGATKNASKTGKRWF